MPGRSVLGKKDCKKLFAYIHDKNFNLDGKSENELMNISEENTFIKVPQTKITVYYNHQGNPMFFKVDQHVDPGFFYIPTIYALKQIPHLIPCFTIHPDVSRFILGGADLMTPGIMLSNNDKLLYPSQFNKGDVFGIRILGNEIPFAVGVTCLDHTLFQQGKGKALEVFHVYGDALWVTGTDASRILPKGILDMGVGSKLSVDEPVGDVEVRKHPDGLVEKEDSIEKEQKKESCDDCMIESHTIGEEMIKDKMKEKGSKVFTEVEWPVQIIDTFLELKKENCTVECLTEEDYIIQSRSLCQSIPGFDLEKGKDVKLLILRKLRDSESLKIVTIQRLHPLYVSYAKIHQQLATDFNKQNSHSFINLNTTFKAPSKNFKFPVLKNEIVEQQDNKVEGWCVIKLYQPNSCSLSIFKEIGIVPRYLNKFYDKSQCFEAVAAYINNHKLLIKQDSGTNQVILDSTLKSCVLTRKHRQKTKEDVPIHLPYQDVLNQFLSLLSIYHGVFMQRSTDSNDMNQENLRVYQGEMKTIHIKEEKRQGTKCITTIQNLYLFDVDAKRLAELLRQSVAASARVVCAKGTETSKIENSLVLIQGSSSMAAIDILTQQFGVPRKYITKS
ncbi:eukaryotic translation initiation factor 2D-like [Hylaeus volcanicus]|uniref:eukaryotic translation initiation factor 2D-like n=1 Tax=Hylaeus volcanicus TaxID=313075 RepID=UPI0023B84AB0|nr:eukaryotic translation initiation factor 2D-like [Hylaeus volcanicus]